jgi:hypothetical protein
MHIMDHAKMQLQRKDLNSMNKEHEEFLYQV